MWPGEAAPITDQWIWPPGRQLVVNLRRFRKERIAQIIEEQERAARCKEQMELEAGAWTPSGLALEYRQALDRCSDPNGRSWSEQPKTTKDYTD